MPTEELFGAYHFLLEVAGGEPTDSFGFTPADEHTQTAIITPAVQLVSIKDEEEATGAYRHEEGPSISADNSANAHADIVKSAGLRSDGDLVQAVSGADMGGDFIL